MSAPPYMKLYIADYHVETTELNVIGHGAYLLLLMAMWRAGGKLPRDEAKLCRLAKCTPEQWAEVRDDVMDHFKVAGGSIKHARVTKEIAKYDAVVSGASTAGKASAAKKTKKDNAKSSTNVDEANQRLGNQPEPEPYSTSEAKASSAPTRVSADAPDFARFWAAYPNKVGKDPARKAFDRAVKRCDVEVMLAAIEQQRTWDQWQRGFVPHAATWLNNGRWQDEPPPTPVTNLNTGRPNVPGPDHKQSSREANNARAFAGAEAASRWRADR